MGAFEGKSREMYFRRVEMSDRQKSLPDIRECYPILPSMLRKYDKFGRRDRFTGETAEDFRQWGEKAKKVLWGLLGLIPLLTGAFGVCPLRVWTNKQACPLKSCSVFKKEKE